MEPRTMSAHEAAEQLRCTRQHIYGLVHRGTLKHFWYGPGRGLRIYSDSVDRYMQDSTRRGPKNLDLEKRKLDLAAAECE